LKEYVRDRLSAELSEVVPVTIRARVKGADSVLQKLQTGSYGKLSDLDDLVGAKVVVLRRSMIKAALDITSTAFDVVKEVQREVRPTEFGYREPHLIVVPKSEYRDRHPELDGLRAELQFTTALQHALDTATHDFDYKGQTFNWQNFRVVAQLRGSLELADSILDNVEASAALMEAGVPPPPEFVLGQEVLDVVATTFAEDAIPRDRVRMASTVRDWLVAVGRDASWLQSAAQAHRDLSSALSLNSTDVALGILLREVGSELVDRYLKQFVVTAELESLCAETGLVPAGRRVQLRG
jgi:ppGpp synthetase/RelA/SpoT-type nucleotidyltranferase